MKFVRIAAFVAAAGAAFAAPAQAQESGPYLGLSLGQSRVDIDEASFNADVTAEGIGHRGFASDESDSAWKIFAGYRVNRHFALEGGLVNLGEFSSTTMVTSVLGVPVLPGTISVTAKTNTGLHASGLGILPLGSQAHLFARLGVYSIETEGVVTIADATGSFAESSSDRNTDLILGFGAGYDFSKNFGVRAEWERYKKVGDEDSIGRGDVDLLSIGLTYRF